MNLAVTEQAAQWYKSELDIADGSNIRFYVRYGGVGGLIPGFSLGINTDQPQSIYTSTEMENITFYIEETDSWYFDEKESLIVSLNDESLEPQFSYE